jgi:hypothetical protein
MTPPVREGSSAAVHASPIAGMLRARVRRGLAIGVMAALVLAFTGAFRTDQIALGPRLAYWFTVILAGSALGLVITWAVQAWGRLARWRWAEMTLASLLIALPLTFIVVVASAISFGGMSIDVPTLLGFFGVVFPVSLVMTLINMTTATQIVVVNDAPAPVAEPTALPALPAGLPAAFAERLPQRLRGGRLIALAAEDHYLRVFTDVGDDLVLMRMADAVALLADVPGARVHRSWWVARAAVTGTTRDGDRVLLTLENGQTAPVSRAERPKLAAAGWF